MMEANCCIFPAPKQYEFTKIISKIVLIPKTKASTLNPNSNNKLLKLPQYYIHKYIIKTEEDNNQFSNHIRARNSEFAYQKVHLGNNNIYTKSNISTMNSNPPLDANCNIQQLPYRVYNDGHSQLSGSHAGNSNGVVPYNSNGISLNSYNQEYTYPNNNIIQIPNLYNSRFQEYATSKQKSQRQTNLQIKSLQFVLEEKYNQKNITKVKDEIPCLFLPARRKDKIWVFFHGNGQDLSTSYQFAYFINRELDIAVIVIEYQGYSIYEGQPSSSNIIEDSKLVLDYLLACGYSISDIILFGRSIGGAIAFQAASHYQSSCLILLSPFLSLKKIAQDLYGTCASTLIKQTLDNATIAQTIKCPILIIHGLKDTLVPYQHSVSILSQCRGYSRLKLVENMTHVRFNFKHDFINPVKKFLVDLSILCQFRHNGL